MRKCFIILTLGLLSATSMARADDLFSRISLDSPFATGPKATGTLPTGEKSPPSDKPQKILSADHLAEMLRDLEMDSKVASDDFVTFKFKHQRWDFPVAINLTDHNSRLWIVFVLTKLEGGKQLKTEQLAGMLTANRDLRPAMFTLADSGKRVELYLTLPNEQISPKVLRDNLETLAGVAENTAGLWEVTSAPAGNGSNKPNGTQNGQPQPNGGNGQIAKQDGPNGQNNRPAQNDGPNGSQQSASTKPVPNSPPPVTSAPSAAAGLMGKWSAAMGEKDAMALLMKVDGSFTMVQVKDGKQGRITGNWIVASGVLTLNGSDGTKITGAFTQTSEKSFDLIPQNGSTKGAKLTFKKAG